MKYSLIIIFCFAFLVLSCDTKTPDDDVLVNVYTELIIAEDTSTLKPSEYKRLVFERFGVSKESYSAAIENYKADPEKWESFFNKAIENLEKRKVQQTIK